MRERGGLLREDDLAEYRPRLPERPLEGSYRGVTIHAAPGATGATTMLEMLNVLSGYDLGALGAGTADALHVWIEAMRLAFADRFQYLADPAFVDVPWHGLLTPEYAAERRRQISPTRALGEYEAGDPWPYEQRPRPAETYLPSRPWHTGGTTHLSVVDRDRNLVALTQTLLSWSGVALPRTGIIMNDAMGWFDPEPSRANSIAPHKRALNNMSPVLLLRDGAPYVTLGAPGGRRIISAIVQSLVNVLDHGLGVQAAVTTPRLHCEGQLTEIDARTPAEVVSDLQRRGHQVKVHEEHASSFRFARPSGIRVDPATNTLTGGVHQYTPAWAMGY
jgi:gamma-glutamyltranspeptidase/glutathione hydrolase